MKGTIHSLKRFAVLMVFLLSACAGGGYEKKIPELYWPEAPNQPRFKVVNYYKTVADVVMKTGLMTDSTPDLFTKPYGLAVTTDGNKIFVADLNGIGVIDVPGKKWSAIKHEFSMPFGLHVTPSGKLYMTDIVAKKVVVMDLDGKIVSEVGRGELNRPSAVAVDEKRGRIYVVESGAHQVAVYDLEGKFIQKIGKGGGAGEGYMHFPSNIALDSRGNVFVTDSMNFRIQSFTPEGEFIQAFGELGDTPGSFARPKGIAIDQYDNVYVVDAAYGNIQVFNTEGRLLTWFSQGGPTTGSLMLPSTVAVDRMDRIYVVEQVNPGVQVFQLLTDEYWAEHPDERDKLISKGYRFGSSPAAAPSSEVAAPEKAPDQKAVPDEAEKPVAVPSPPPAAKTAPAASGEAALLVKMLEIRFGSLTAEDRQRIESANPETLQKWGARLLSAQDIKDVFKD